MNDLTLTAGDHLRLRFFCRGDRWQHVVEYHDADQLIWQLESAGSGIAASEIAADENWPFSPPFQSLEMHAAPGGRTCPLLVGMAGASHWSASVEADADREQFLFDVACRVKMEPAWLGSCYVGEAPLVAATSPHLALIHTPTTAAQATIETVGQRIIIRVAEGSGPLPRTVRWQYLISATTSG